MGVATTIGVPVKSGYSKVDEGDEIDEDDESDGIDRGDGGDESDEDDVIDGDGENDGGGVVVLTCSGVCGVAGAGLTD